MSELLLISYFFAIKITVLSPTVYNIYGGGARKKCREYRIGQPFKH
jgi:hypothetical protein